jgi:hypothetical protein
MMASKNQPISPQRVSATLPSRFVVTFFADQHTFTKHQLCCSLAEIAVNIQKAHAPAKDQLPWLKLAGFGDRRSDKNALRHDANIVAISGVEGDYDGGALTFDEAVALVWEARVKAVLYTTPSSTDAKPHWRVLCPASMPLCSERRGKLMDRVNGIVGGGLDRASWTLSQSYYFGSIDGKPPVRIAIIDGEDCSYIDLRDDLPVIPKPGGRRATTKPAKAQSWNIEAARHPFNIEMARKEFDRIIAEYTDAGGIREGERHHAMFRIACYPFNYTDDLELVTKWCCEEAFQLLEPGRYEASDFAKEVENAFDKRTADGTLANRAYPLSWLNLVTIDFGDDYVR